MGSRSVLYLAILCVAVATVGACSTPAEQPRQYELSGQILAVRLESDEVVIKHGDIKGFMPGMTMPFKVRDRSLLEGKSPGDLVTAQLMVATDDAWLAKLDKTGTAPLEDAAPSSAAAFVRPLAPGDAVGEADLSDQNGTPLTLAQLRGTAVVITFIYTRCPLPQFCPMMDRRFAELQRAIADDASLNGRVRLLSISFDPEHDRPAVLKAHAAKLQADPAIWTFATAPAADVDRLAARFGVNVIREADRTITHNLRTAVVDPRGVVVAVHDSNDWTAEEIVVDLRRALAGQ